MFSVVSKIWRGAALFVLSIFFAASVSYAQEEDMPVFSDSIAEAFVEQGLDYDDFLETYQRGLLEMQSDIGEGDNAEGGNALPQIEFLPDNPERAEDSDMFEAILLFDEGAYGEAFPLLLRAALADDAEATYLVGRSFEYGYHVETNIETAIEWYARAAETHYRPAMVALARLHLTSDNVAEEDVQSALNLLQFLSDYAAAQYWLGVIYHPERGWQNDAELSFAWFMAAATKGHRRAIFEVSEAFCYGYGVEAVPEQAYIWRALAYDILAYDVRAWEDVSCGDEGALTIDDILEALADSAEMADIVPVYEGWE